MDWQIARNGSDRARFGPFEVDLHTHELWKFGTRLKLAGQPFEILAVLMRRPGELVTREELRTRLWPVDTFVDFSHGLNAAVNKLRETLSDSANAPRYIETLPRRGYRFICAVEWSAAKSALPDTSSSGISVPLAAESQHSSWTSIEAVTAPDRAQAPGGSGLSRYLMGAGVLFTLLVASALLLKSASTYSAGGSPRSMVQHNRPLTAILDTATPAFSPDGDFVAFFREHSQRGASGIYVIAVGSDQLAQLTSNEHDRSPVWSPDGRWIAFSRLANQAYSLHIVAADGGREQKRKAEERGGATSTAFMLTSYGAAERELATGGVMARREEIDWSPDGKYIAFVGATGIYLRSFEDSAVRRLTEPPAMVEDWGPTFSPDGRKVMFVRNHAIGTPDEIWVIPTGGGEATRLFSERGRISSPPQWSYDGHSVIFSSNRTGHPALWRVSLDAPDSAVQITEAGTPAWDPAVSRRGYRLAYERLLRSLSIWQMNLSNSNSGGKRPYLTVSSTSDTDQGPGPQFSPDGKKLAYMSDRSGTMEIWVSNRDGGNPFQLTAVGGAGTPRWSPDSQSVAFDVTTPTGSKIVTMNLHGGAPQTLTADEFHSVCPSWSHDVKWIYFASPRSGEWQVWKVPATGGAPVQVTQHGGHAALESFDGKFVYYAKTPMAEPEIWRVSVDGGAESPLPLVRPGTWASWQVVRGGILFVGPSLGHQAVLSFYDFARQRTSTVEVLEHAPFWLGATPDGRTVAFDQPGQEQAQTMLVDNFR
jgi:Tol biopolymer transport system component/DNA-binding winged helix-turn-helix (wHTH) protein